ncbi:MAG: site-2 protease family protein [Candidatus Bathyarchaeia archaeon]
MIVYSLAAFYMPSHYPAQPAWVYWAVGIVAALLLLFSVLFHELCHSYMAKRRGIAVPDITLFLFGGVSRILEEPSDPGIELKMAAAGPLSSFGLAILLRAAWLIASYLGAGVLILAPLHYGSLINVLLGAFNLMPAFPMDGGRILRAALWRWRGSLLEATGIATRVGSAFAYFFMFLGFILMFTASFLNGIWLVIIGWFLKSGAESSLKQTIISNALAELKVRDIMTTSIDSIGPDAPVSEIVESFMKYKHGGFPVMRDGEFLGLVTISDVKRVPREDWDRVRASDIMKPRGEIISASPEDPIVEAMVKMSAHGIGRLPVIEDGELKGIITRSDLMRTIRIRTELGR